MTFFYMDTDAGSDANDGTTWALAKLTLEGLLAVMAAGDTGFVQGLADDTAAASRTFTVSASTQTNPIHIKGVKDGTTNEGAAIVAADLVVRGTDTLPKIEATGAGNDITFSAGHSMFTGLNITAPDRLVAASASTNLEFNMCKLSFGGLFLYLNSNSSRAVLNDCEIESTASGFIFTNLNGSQLVIKGGKFTATVAPSASLFYASARYVDIIGWDFSSLGAKNIITPDGTMLGGIVLRNCKTPTTFTLYGGSGGTYKTSIELVGCSDTSSVAVGDSVQDYQYEDLFGSIDLDVTAVRSGGADDDASGAFAYAMTPKASATLESSNASLKSPWMTVWLAGGANTLTVYIANDGAVDYNEDEAWVEFYTPDAGDTAQHDQTFDPADERLLDSTTTITDDATSTWGGTAANGQKFSATVTTGFEGFAYARLHVAKRQATPDTVFLDPVIVVT